MANNPYVNKVEFAGQTIIDISDTSIDVESIPDGSVVYLATGERVVGRAIVYSVANNLTTETEGYALDARQGKVLDTKKLDKDISSLTALPQNPVTGDVFVVQNSSSQYKIDYNALANAILSRLHVSIPSTATTWSAVWAIVNGIGNYADFTCSGANVVKLLSGQKLSSSSMTGMIRRNGNVFSFMAYSEDGLNYAQWNVTFASGGASATVGEVYSFVCAKL